MSKNLNANLLLAYADAGFTLFPLNGKIPPKGLSWPQAPFNPLPAPKDFPSGNFGVKLTEDDLVIDVDPRNFPKDTDIPKLFQDAMPIKLKGATFTVKTGSGGQHLYFKKPAGFNIKGAIKGFPGIEFKTKGQYVVGASSLHPDTGKPYTIMYGTPSERMDAPQGLLDMIARVEVTADKTIVAVTYLSDEQTKNRFIQYLTTAPIAIEGEGGDRTTFSVAAVAHDFGLHPDIALELMAEHYNPKCEPAWAYPELKTKVYNAYRYSAEVAGAKSAQGQFPKALPTPTVADLRLNDRGRPENTVYNTVTCFNIDMSGMLALNVWSEDLVFMKPAPWHEDEIVPYWSDKDSARLRYYLGRERLFEPMQNKLEDALVEVGQQQKFHPIKQDLESYVWDGVPRIKDWLIKYCGALDTAYGRQVGLKVLVAAIKRVYEPGCKFDYIMVLEGPQGIGKSQVVEILGGEYYGDIDLDLHDKETIEKMRRYWIIEASEMEAVRKHESTAMKAFLSRKTDTFRVPYGKRAREFKRQSIFIGTLNPEKSEEIGWLKDSTGNRRYWPIRCGKILLPALRIIRNQLWAEALVYYRRGTPLYFEDTAIEEAAIVEQSSRMSADAWLEQVEAWLYDHPIGKTKNLVTASNIYCDCLGGRFANITTTEQRRIADVMRILGWEKGSFHSSEAKRSVRSYRRPKSDS